VLEVARGGGGNVKVEETMMMRPISAAQQAAEARQLGQSAACATGQSPVACRLSPADAGPRASRSERHHLAELHLVGALSCGPA